MVEVIAEAGQCHGGSLKVAKELARMAGDRGATWAKFQMFDPLRLCSSAAVRYWDKELGGNESQKQTFLENGGLTAEEWMELKRFCDEEGMVRFLCTPFDLEAVEELEKLGVEAYKIASGDITFRDLVTEVGKTRKKVFMSTGASTLGEIRQAVEWVVEAGCPEIVLLACTLAYPTENRDAGLGRIRMLHAEFGVRVGYSDHTQGVMTGGLAVAAGASVLEKHCALGGGKVPDQQMGLMPKQLEEYVVRARAAEQMMGKPDRFVLGQEVAAREQARRGWWATENIPEGQMIGKGQVRAMRPAIGALGADLDLWGQDVGFGVRTVRRIEAGEAITWDNVQAKG